MSSYLFNFCLYFLKDLLKTIKVLLNFLLIALQESTLKLRFIYVLYFFSQNYK